MKKLLVCLGTIFVLTGCATNADYKAYAEIHKAQAKAQEARYAALAEIAKQGDTTAKVAAVMSLNQAGSGESMMRVAPPKSPGETILQWSAVLFPSLTTMYSVNKQTQLGMVQSNNATALGMNTNNSFVSIAGKIQAPAPNVTTTTTTNTTNTNTLSGTGVMGSGTYENHPSASTYNIYPPVTPDAPLN